MRILWRKALLVLVLVSALAAMIVWVTGTTWPMNLFIGAAIGCIGATLAGSIVEWS